MGGRRGFPNYTVQWVERTPSGANQFYRSRGRTCGFDASFCSDATLYEAAANWVIGIPVTDWRPRHRSPA
jgi:hypothetical protein